MPKLNYLESFHRDDPRYVEEVFIDTRQPPSTHPKPWTRNPIYFFGWRIFCFFGFHHKITYPHPMHKWRCRRCRKSKWSWR